MTPKDFGYSWGQTCDLRSNTLPPGFRICRAGSRVPCLQIHDCRRVRYFDGNEGWGTPPQTDYALGKPERCACWPDCYAVIATDLPGFGEAMDFTNADEGGVV